VTPPTNALQEPPDLLDLLEPTDSPDQLEDLEHLERKLLLDHR